MGAFRFRNASKIDAKSYLNKALKTKEHKCKTCIVISSMGKHKWMRNTSFQRLFEATSVAFLFFKYFESAPACVAKRIEFPHKDRAFELSVKAFFYRFLTRGQHVVYRAVFFVWGLGLFVVGCEPKFVSRPILEPQNLDFPLTRTQLWHRFGKHANSSNILDT